MDYNIFYIEQVNYSGSLVPELPYYVTNGDKNSRPLFYGSTQEECQEFIDNNS